MRKEDQRVEDLTQIMLLALTPCPLLTHTYCELDWKKSLGIKHHFSAATGITGIIYFPWIQLGGPGGAGSI